MGQKVNPYGFRVGIINDWRTRWYTEKDFAAYLHEDIKIRRHVIKNLSHAGLSKIEIERTEQQVKIVIHAGRPGIVIGKKGAEVDKLRTNLEKLTGKRVKIDIQEVRRPEISAPLIAQNIASQLEGRVSFRRAMKKAVSQAMQGGVKGIKIASAGRLGGAEMSRTEWYREGRVPLHTLKADIEYGTAEANTKSGKIGVKVWVYLGDVSLNGRSIRHENRDQDIMEENARPRPPRPMGKPREAAPTQKISVADQMQAEKRYKEAHAAATATVAKETPVVETEAKKPVVKKTAEVASEPKAPRKDVKATEVKAEAKPVAEKKPAVKKEAAPKAEKKETVPAAEKKPAAKKPAAKKPTAAAKPAAAKKPAVKKPAVKKAPAKKEEK